MPDEDPEELEKIRNGNSAAIARAISRIEEHPDRTSEFMERLRSGTRTARRIGITGPPGSGKSTLLREMVPLVLEQNLSAGIIAIDPSSPLTGGALMGDRIRFGTDSGDAGVFVRSMASKGAAGGLSPSTAQACDILEAAGKDVIFVETVGVGQNDVEIRSVVDQIVLVLTPESGDSIQTMKAGIMEVADVIVINKADRPEAARLEKDLLSMLQIRGSLSGEDGDEQKTPNIIKTVARNGKGVDELIQELGIH